MPPRARGYPVPGDCRECAVEFAAAPKIGKGPRGYLLRTGVVRAKEGVKR